MSPQLIFELHRLRPQIGETSLLFFLVLGFMNKEKTLANLKQQFFLFFVDKYLRKSKVFDP